MRLIKTAAVLLLCIIVMQYLHELGHALVSKALGYDVSMSINKVASSGQSGPVPLWHSQLIALGGPAATICIAVLAFLGRRRLGDWALIIVFNAMIMRMIAAAVSFSHPNDEAWVSSSLNLGTWTLPLLVCAFLAGLFGIVLKEVRPRWQWFIAMWAGVSIGYSAVVLAEKSFPQFAF